MTRIAVCTIVSRNYLALARTLMASITHHHPTWEPVVLLVDEVGDYFDPAAEPFEVVGIQALALPDFPQMAFRSSILELNTAAKPWLLESLLERGYDAVVYLDPDIDVHAPLREVEQSLDGGASLVLTPHLTAPLEEDHRPNDLDIVRAGAYNLGFAALSRCEESARLLKWWRAKTAASCVVDLERGLFVDQRWMDLAPGLFANVHILRHEGYNVAYWNLDHRALCGSAPNVRVNGAPLVFFHWSGLDSRDPEQLSVHQNRFRLSQLPAVEALARDYLARLAANGHDECAQWPYAFGCFDDGVPIIDPIRALYRAHPEVREDAGANPFALGHGYFNESVDRRNGPPLMSRAMLGLWETSPRLRARFADPGGADRRAFALYFTALHAAEHRLPRPYVDPVLASLSAGPRIAGHRLTSRATGTLLRALRPFVRQLGDDTRARLRALLGVDSPRP